MEGEEDMRKEVEEEEEQEGKQEEEEVGSSPRRSFFCARSQLLYTRSQNECMPRKT